jgi:hypothetical protein
MKRFTRIGCVKFPTTSKWSSGKNNRLVSCTRYGPSLTVVVLWFKNCWILIIQASEKIRWINCASLPTTNKWSSGKDNRLVSRASCGSSLTEAVLCFKSCWVLIIQAREKNMVNLSYASLSTTSRWCSGKHNRLVSITRCGSNPTHAIL